MFFKQKLLSRSRSKVKVKVQGQRSKVKVIQHKQKGVICMNFRKTLKKMPTFYFQGHSQGQGHIPIFPAISPIFSHNLRNQPIF